MFIPKTPIKKNPKMKRMMHDKLDASYSDVAGQMTARSITNTRITVTASIPSEMRLLQKKPYLQMLPERGCILVRIIITVNFTFMKI